MYNWEIIKACERGDYIKIKSMVESDNSCLKEYDRQGHTPLHCLLISGSDEMVRYLIERGADIEARTVSGNTPLMIACDRGRLNLVKYLIEQGADINAKDKVFKGSVFHHAARGGHPNVIEFLISLGADVNEIKYDGWTPLHLACIRGKLAAAKLLINHGADIKATAYDGTTVLKAAEISYNHDIIDFVKYLLKVDKRNGQFAMNELLKSEISNAKG